MMLLKAMLPNPTRKLSAAQKTPLRHNFTLQVMLALPVGVNGKEGSTRALAGHILASSPSPIGFVDAIGEGADGDTRRARVLPEPGQWIVNE
jgi:hypothetical protein